MNYGTNDLILYSQYGSTARGMSERPKSNDQRVCDGDFAGCAMPLNGSELWPGSISAHSVIGNNSAADFAPVSSKGVNMSAFMSTPVKAKTPALTSVNVIPEVNGTATYGGDETSSRSPWIDGTQNFSVPSNNRHGGDLLVYGNEQSVSYAQSHSFGNSSLNGSQLDSRSQKPSKPPLTHSVLSPYASSFDMPRSYVSSPGNLNEQIFVSSHFIA